jgi:hypothetical protein
MIIPPGINGERQKDAADNCGCFNCDAFPGDDLGFRHVEILQLPNVRFGSFPAVEYKSSRAAGNVQKRPPKYSDYQLIKPLF